MGAVNDLRLVIGTRLDVSEDDGPISTPTTPTRRPARSTATSPALLDDIVDALDGDGLGPTTSQSRPIAMLGLAPTLNGEQTRASVTGSQAPIV